MLNYPCVTPSSLTLHAHISVWFYSVVPVWAHTRPPICQLFSKLLWVVNLHKFQFLQLNTWSLLSAFCEWCDAFICQNLEGQRWLTVSSYSSVNNTQSAMPLKIWNKVSMMHCIDLHMPNRVSDVSCYPCALSILTYDITFIHCYCAILYIVHVSFTCSFLVTFSTYDIYIYYMHLCLFLYPDSLHM